MSSYLHPGVYLEEIPSGVRPIEGVSTSTAAILGYATKGPIGEPELIFNWDIYDQQYGGIRDTTDGSVDVMGYSAFAFFQNGGRKAYIVRLAVNAVKAFAVLPLPYTEDTVLKVEAVNEGAWGNELQVTLIQQADDDDGVSQFTVIVSEIVDGRPQERERFKDLTFVDDHRGFIKVKVNDVSRYIKVDLVQPQDSVFLRGAAVSGELKNLDLTTINGQSLKVTVDGGNLISVDFAADQFTSASKLAHVAQYIQDTIRNEDEDNEAHQKFTAEVLNDGLTLTSGSRLQDSAVTVSDGTAATTLKFPANQGGNAVTGHHWLNFHFTPHFPAYSLSGDLSNLVDLTTLNGKGVKVTVDGVERNVNFAAAEFTSDSNLSDVAEKVQSKVRGTTTNRRTRDFVATVEGKKIRLVSGGGERASAVAVGAPSSGTNAALLLCLGVANGGEEKDGISAMKELISENGGGGIETELMDGLDGDQPGQDEYTKALTKFRKIRDASIFLLPGQVYANDGKAIIDAAIAHAGEMTNRMVIVDSPSGTELTSPSDVSALGLPTSTYSVLYYPYVKVRNPHYDEEKRPDRPKTVPVPPSAYAAGIWSKTDGRRGVWKAPAGVETALLGADSLEFTVGDDEQDQLNPLGVNCIRQLNVAGLAARVVWGSRTLATKADPEWRYVPVRRTAIFIEESIYNAIHWAVFEPNDHPLWSSLRVNIDSFMNGLFRAGAFQGEKASDAYFVRCGLDDTMTQGDIDRGQVIVIVGFAPLKPAEFVIVRIQQKVQQQ
ncbi:MAG: phage tail sheath family protein [Planctomycetota bacterium]|jgi:phage tail sheath protein FI